MEITIKANSRTPLFSFKELLSYRDLFYFLAIRDIKVKYRQTIIGILWAVLQPLITMIIFTFFFNKLAGISSGKIPYILFSYLGLIFWNFFSVNLIEVSNSLINNKAIITKVFFPRIIIPISALIVGIVDFIFSFILLIFLMVMFKHIPSFFDIIVIFLGLGAVSLFVVGFGLLMAGINVKYRDVRYALPFFVQLLLFLTPVIYPISAIPKNLSWLMYLNPLTGILDLIRGFIFNDFYNINYIFISIIVIIFFLILGLFYFNRYEREIADVI